MFLSFNKPSQARIDDKGVFKKHKVKGIIISETTSWSIPRLPKSRQVGKNTIVQVMKNCLVERITRKNHC
nr:MAG TPA: hypothetical protein [Caudoviricetes sp.]DAM91975.1 MAG TPA: hypothetical protein [Caudoviricetes sp.]